MTSLKLPHLEEAAEGGEAAPPPPPPPAAEEGGEEGAEAAEAAPAPAEDGGRSVTLQVEMWDSDMDAAEKPPLFKGTVTISAVLGAKTPVVVELKGADEAECKLNFTCAHTLASLYPPRRHLTRSRTLFDSDPGSCLNPRPAGVHTGARALSA